MLEDANIKLGDVASDVTGVSGRAMLTALCRGETNAEALADLARGVSREKREALAEALEGRVNAHHRFLLTQHLEHLAFVEAQIAGFDAEIGIRIEQMSASSPDGPPPGGSGDDTAAHVTTGKHGLPSEPPSYARAVELALPIPGIGPRAVQAIFAEMGVDMRRFPSAGHLTSWAGVAPGNRESAGKRLSGKTTHGNAALRKALVQAAHGACRAKDTSFKALYHRIAARRGRKRALVAGARAILGVLYHAAALPRGVSGTGRGLSGRTQARGHRQAPDPTAAQAGL